MTVDEQERTGLGHEHRRARRPAGAGRPRRSRVRIIAGVAGGLAEFIGAEPRTVRWLWGISLPLSGGLTAVAYLVLWLMLPAQK